MKQILKFLPIAMLLFISCSTMKYNIARNNRSTDRLVSSLCEKNGNVFYLKSTYTTFSRVWTYGEKSIEIYKLANGKIIERAISPDEGISQYEVPLFKALEAELRTCGYELDGDVFGFRVMQNSEISKQDFPISIESFSKHKYEADFLNKIVKDINTHKLWVIEYVQ